MKLVFLSNYFNHHEKPLSDALFAHPGIEYTFIQTEKMAEERVRMGWGIDTKDIPYVRYFDDDPEGNRDLVMNADCVIFGGVDDESYIMPRLEARRLTLRYQERIYKEGQWKFISPRGLRKKYHDHTRFKNDPVYLLCAGAYVASDFSLIHAYPGKKYVWGYFPEFIEHDIDALISSKEENELLWTGRMIDWKHPDAALKSALYLKEKNISFHLTMAGGGELEDSLKQFVTDNGLDKFVTFTGFLKPAEIRTLMEKASVYIFTSDEKEGWGAVVNEAMNSGCAVVASHAAGAVPYLLRHKDNGLVYKSGRQKELDFYLENLLEKNELRCRLGKNAYHTIAGKWNASYAANRLADWLGDRKETSVEKIPSPMDIAECISPGKGYDFAHRNL